MHLSPLAPAPPCLVPAAQLNVRGTAPHWTSRLNYLVCIHNISTNAYTSLQPLK